MEDDNERLAAGLRQGRPEAWQQLYDAHAERVWRLAARLLGPSHRQALRDVLQDVFLAAARNAATYDPAKGTPWAWLCGILRRQVALRHRRAAARADHLRRWWQGLDGHARAFLAGTRDAPPEVLASKELAEAVRRTLAALPPDYQALLTRRYMDGESPGEIARGDRSSSDAVRAKLLRARRAFRDRFPNTPDVQPGQAGSADHE